MAASMTKVDERTNSADQTAYTFGDVSLGAAASDRYIAVAVGARAGNGGDFDAVTIGGVSATQVVSVINGTTQNTTAGLFIAHVPDGTTGDVVVAFTSTRVRIAITVWRIVGTTGVAVSTDSLAGGSQTVSLDIPAGGVACAASYTHANAAPSWTGLTQDTDLDVEGTSGQYSSAH